MENKLLLEVVTPQRLVLSIEVDDFTAPGFRGEFGVLPGHTPFLAKLKIGEISYRVGSERSYMAVHLGYVEVGPKKVVVLAETAERAEEIDVDRARAARERAERRLQYKGEEAEVDFDRARVALARSVARLQVAVRTAR